MKASFFYTVWLSSYILIDWLDIPLLSNNSFVCAFIIMFICDRYAENAFSESIASQRFSENVVTWEQIYTNDKKGYLKDKQIEIAGLILVTAYLIISLVGFFCLGFDDLFAYVVFTIAAIVSVRELNKQIKAYNYANNHVEPFENESRMIEGYNQYRWKRSMGESAMSILKTYSPTTSYKVTMLISSILAVLLGGCLVLYYSQYLFEYNISTPYVISSFMYGTLSLLFGIKDLASAYRIRSLKKRLTQE